MYFDEDLLLDIRLNSLDNFVKKFVITEATYTHNGDYKKLRFDINKIIWIYGASDGHSSFETIRAIKKYSPKIILTKSRLPKAKSPSSIVKELKNLNLDIIELTSNTSEAFKLAKSLVNTKDCIVAFGSLYIAAEIVELLKNIKPEKYTYE